MPKSPAFTQHCIHFRREKPHAASSLGLGPVEAASTLPISVSVFRKNGNANAETGHDLMVSDLNLFRWGILEPLYKSLSSQWLRTFRDKGELVSPNPREESVRRGSLKTPRDLTQECIAGWVAEHVIDFSEAVKIEAQHREPLL